MRATRRIITRTCHRCGGRYNVTIDLEFPTASTALFDVCARCVAGEREDDDRRVDARRIIDAETHGEPPF